MRLSAVIAAAIVSIYVTQIHAYDINDWPTHHTFSDGTDIGATLDYQYDINRFSNDSLPNGSNRFEDAETNRRKEFGFTLKKKGVYDATVQYDFQNKVWIDNFIRFESKVFFGKDYGKFRFGYSKTPVGFESVTGARATSFLETALPEQAIFEGRRMGVDWAFERPQYILNAGYYFGQDLQGDNDGSTIAARAAWTPLKTDTEVLHLGISASRENPDRSVTNGKHQEIFATARLRSRPEAGLTPIRLIDSGALPQVDKIERLGLEGLWIHGPWSAQGEYLNQNVKRDNNLPDFSGNGFYLFGSYVVTGESRPYANGNIGNIKPKGDWGAFEVLLRYSTLDLNDDLIAGGKEHDWTLGVNWYLTQHFKLQANYIRAYSDKGNLSLDPSIFEMRAQIYF